MNISSLKTVSLKDRDDCNEKMLQEYVQNGGNFIPKLDENKKPIPGEYASGWKPEEVQAFNAAMYAARQQQQQAQMMAEAQVVAQAAPQVTGAMKDLQDLEMPSGENGLEALAGLAGMNQQ